MSGVIPLAATMWWCRSLQDVPAFRAVPGTGVSGNWFRSYGNENWEFDARGLMQRRYASINDLPISEHERRFRWPLGRRPDDHPGLSELGL